MCERRGAHSGCHPILDICQATSARCLHTLCNANVGPSAQKVELNGKRRLGAVSWRPEPGFGVLVAREGVRNDHDLRGLVMIEVGVAGQDCLRVIAGSSAEEGLAQGEEAVLGGLRGRGVSERRVVVKDL